MSQQKSKHFSFLLSEIHCPFNFKLFETSKNSKPPIIARISPNQVGFEVRIAIFRNDKIIKKLLVLQLSYLHLLLLQQLQKIYRYLKQYKKYRKVSCIFIQPIAYFTSNPSATASTKFSSTMLAQWSQIRAW